MSDMEVQPDPITRTALQRLPIPGHEDSFWRDLSDQIDAEAAAPADGRSVFAPATAATVVEPGAPPVDGEPVPLERDPALALVPRALRRPSNGVLLAVAAAAAVVVTLAGTTLLQDRNGTTSLTSDEQAQTGTSPDPVAQDEPSEDETPSMMSAAGSDASSEAVLAWVEDLGTGDGTAAWEAMGAASQAHFGTQEAFEAEMTALAEGYGAWAEAEPDDVLVTPVLSNAEGAIAVVTLIGVVDRSDGEERRADAFPVRIVDGDAVLEPFAKAGAIEVVVPEATPAGGEPVPVAPDEELVVVVPSDVEAPILRLDDGEAVVCGEEEGSELTDLEGASGQRCSYLPPDGITAGEHTLTMAFLGSDGESISAGTVLFDAA